MEHGEVFWGFFFGESIFLYLTAKPAVPFIN